MSGSSSPAVRPRPSHHSSPSRPRLGDRQTTSSWSLSIAPISTIAVARPHPDPRLLGEVRSLPCSLGLIALVAPSARVRAVADGRTPRPSPSPPRLEPLPRDLFGEPPRAPPRPDPWPQNVVQVSSPSSHRATSSSVTPIDVVPCAFEGGIHPGWRDGEEVGAEGVRGGK